MSQIMLVAAALLSPASTLAVDTLTVPAPAVDRVEAGYDDLAAGRARQAMDRIKAGGALRQSDPSALINMGSAEAMLGHTDKAGAMYRAAIASKTQYDLQLADGSWMDSRRAARLALTMLDRGERLALK